MTTSNHCMMSMDGIHLEKPKGTPKMPLMTIAGSRLTLEIAIVMVGATALAEAGAVGGIDPADLTVLWCIVGGCLGAFCSLHFFRVPPSPHIKWDIGWQFFVNLILSGVFSPLLVPAAVKYSGLRELQVAVAIACTVGIVAQQFVGRIALPLFAKIAEKRAAKLASELGVERDDGRPETRPSINP